MFIKSQASHRGRADVTAEKGHEPLIPASPSFQPPHRVSVPRFASRLYRGRSHQLRVRAMRWASLAQAIQRPLRTEERAFPRLLGQSSRTSGRARRASFTWPRHPNPASSSTTAVVRGVAAPERGQKLPTRDLSGPSFAIMITYAAVLYAKQDLDAALVYVNGISPEGSLLRGQLSPRLTEGRILSARYLTARHETWCPYNRKVGRTFACSFPHSLSCVKSVLAG
ncbi:hypothetical protein GGR56DRAFT_456667 [Xylariaceae sp. FL0804]|nr:hypothetical protein GGR56DRAFT_456667 [Xylariaceae sp. FL0804]